MAEAGKLTIKVNEADSVTAMLYPAAKKNRAGVTIILGHGAGADQLSGFMRMAAAGLAERGLDAMTFNFIYKEKGKSVPDPKAKLEACYLAVIEAAEKNKKLKATSSSSAASRWVDASLHRLRPRTQTASMVWSFSVIRCIHRDGSTSYVTNICQRSKRRCSSCRDRAMRLGRKMRFARRLRNMA